MVSRDEGWRAQPELGLGLELGRVGSKTSRRTPTCQSPNRQRWVRERRGSRRLSGRFRSILQLARDRVSTWSASAGCSRREFGLDSRRRAVKHSKGGVSNVTRAKRQDERDAGRGTATCQLSSPRPFTGASASTYRSIISCITVSMDIHAALTCAPSTRGGSLLTYNPHYLWPHRVTTSRVPRDIQCRIRNEQSSHPTQSARRQHTQQ
jgi:hypothetical protein